MTESRIANIAFCSDAYMEAPLHVAASSVLRSLHRDWSARIYLLVEGVAAESVRRLRRTLDRCERPYELVEIADADTGIFSRSKLRPFHGSYAAYYRLLLPDHVREKRLLYLDTDTVTTLDVSPLFQLDMESFALGFVVDGKVEFALEHRFFVELGSALTDPAFNSGVMLFDIEQWRNQSCFSRIMDFCNAHPDRLVAADQTALNVLFAKCCRHLSPEFNVKLSTVWREPVPESGVFHYVGSPKPWDILGEFLHPYSDIWLRAAKPIALPFPLRSAYASSRSWIRFTRILGGYRRILQQRRELAKAARSRQ